MKTKKKKVLLTPESVERRSSSCDLMFPQGVFYYTFSSREHIPNIETMEHFIEVEEAETLKEFRKLKDVSKEELVEFLNQNFK